MRTAHPKDERSGDEIEEEDGSALPAPASAAPSPPAAIGEGLYGSPSVEDRASPIPELRQPGTSNLMSSTQAKPFLNMTTAEQVEEYKQAISRRHAELVNLGDADADNSAFQQGQTARCNSSRLAQVCLLPAHMLTRCLLTASQKSQEANAHKERTPTHALSSKRSSLAPIPCMNTQPSFAPASSFASKLPAMVLPKRDRECGFHTPATSFTSGGCSYS
jgi:hypothetical protein